MDDLFPYTIKMKRIKGDLRTGIVEITVKVYASSYYIAEQYAITMANEFSKTTEPTWAVVRK